MTDTPVMTDPARELADTLSHLSGGHSNGSGAEFLASTFGVAPWSREFYQVISTLMERLERLKIIIRELPLDDDYRAEMEGHVDDIALAFGPPGFQNAWHSFGTSKLSAANLQPLKSLSGLVRQKVAYRKLSPDEINELIATVAELREWLDQHQLAEQDFIRQALIEGLDQLSFRLSKFQWLGWGYTLESLREVIGAYMLLERERPNPQDNPDAEAVLKKTAAVIKAVYEKLQAVKKVSDTGDWLLKAYGGATLLIQGSTVIQGLLTHQ